jgi:hypothetical protein
MDQETRTQKWQNLQKPGLIFYERAKQPNPDRDPSMASMILFSLSTASLVLNDPQADEYLNLCQQLTEEALTKAEQTGSAPLRQMLIKSLIRWIKEEPTQKAEIYTIADKTVAYLSKSPPLTEAYAAIRLLLRCYVELGDIKRIELIKNNLPADLWDDALKNPEGSTLSQGITSLQNNQTLDQSWCSMAKSLINNSVGWEDSQGLTTIEMVHYTRIISQVNNDTRSAKELIKELGVS